MRRALLFGLVTACALVVAAPAQADFAFRWYAFAGSGCDRKADPITVLFYGDATSGRARNHLDYHTGWWATYGPDQYFSDHGYCQEEQWENGNGGLRDRFHVRANQGMHRDYESGLGWHTVATPHDEDWYSSCLTHVVEDNGEGGHNDSGFDHGRRAVRYRMSTVGPHYSYSRQLWNTELMYQPCDRSYVGSNGYVAYIRIPDWNH